MQTIPPYYYYIKNLFIPKEGKEGKHKNVTIVMWWLFFRLFLQVIQKENDFIFKVCLPVSFMSNYQEKTSSEQGNIQGQRKEVDVQDYPSAVELANILKDVNFPADKNTIINSVKNSNAANNKNISDFIEKIEDKQYNNSAEVVSATGLVSR
jgi:hypothetical protein